MEINRLKPGTKLSLANDGRLSLFFVGVGSAFTKRHYQTNLLIIKGNDHIMIDCGSKTPQALYELGVNVSDIKNFLITHSHADHIGGLEEVMLTGRFVTKKNQPLLLIKNFSSSYGICLCGVGQLTTTRKTDLTSPSAICGTPFGPNGCRNIPGKLTK